jgi:mono/diheme cytochrome c family protein
MNRPLVFLSALLFTGGALSAKAPWVKKAQKEGFSQIQNCRSCHAADKPNAKGEPFGEVAKWLIEQKKTRKAQEVDLAWLKEYYAKKK